MSGEGRKTIHKETGSGGWPNGLTVDYLERRILWIDARSNKKKKYLLTFTFYRSLQKHVAKIVTFTDPMPFILLSMMVLD